MISDRPITDETSARQMAVEVAEAILHSDTKLKETADRIRDWLLDTGAPEERQLRAWALRHYLNEHPDPRGIELDWLLARVRERYDYARGAR